MKSKLLIDDAIVNTEQKDGEVDFFYPCIIDCCGVEHLAFFTDLELSNATQRAITNPEDIEQLRKHHSFWESAKEWLFRR